ncbi:MAG: hypothetical protein ACKOWF_15990 [Chloroflexota bacterium]
MDRIGELLRVQDGRFWVLIALCVALVYTIQAAETSVEGMWPHQRRPARMTQGARAVAGAWSWVALLLLPGLLLAVLNLAVLIQQGLPQTQVQVLGALFVAVSWLVFVLASTNAFGMGRYMGQVGAVGPAALMGMLAVGDILLLIALLDILPAALDAARGIAGA